MPQTAAPRARRAVSKPPKPPTPASLVERAQSALRDVQRARRDAEGDLRRHLDTAAERLRDIVADLRHRAEDEGQAFEERLERTTEDARRELGVRAVRAQRTPQALTKMSSEITRRRAELTAKPAAGNGAPAKTAPKRATTAKAKAKAKTTRSPKATKTAKAS